MNPSYIKKTSAVWALILIGLFLLFKNWLPFREAILLAMGLPFLYFLPGFLIIKVFFRAGLDQIEAIFLAMLFSLMLLHMGIYTVEENTRMMTIADIALTVAVINILCALIYLAHRKQLSPARLLSRLRSKLHKRDHKQP
ncbi:hypothetical protein A3B21_04135 [Candidatus Uhrbacteria bacterium RIFCSPLOWO2_01_FULL_47_24]|uniref:DUF1616 domain-containing protein n=1 Tax=Candidatus Uhrbacteria bacterium RIFCSPLOWO2_01_FULL_47_24 TaxID=1802401 RepID=A0A1F7UTE9_9BACT|nr:MAG: hypothetical protein A2753_02450 [Candidatus Uhrbacteria bacterium RIFCSPHIGHO2_01_FULL_47_11]OGL68775.1 MAG: hypothetical protein A3D58_01340 [Candidatus Uhrbacteria bacterium RIFCSPHIGHO2_02_FULL_46_47]OGL81580.1 MAG: hypothetical protein A3B21_04135 [Candidatus Uhrbacteria bacterium RIFCSPLOWO2_01_FULL_47_24]OGL83962.1 MAG: hypothetical protein A3J03_00900 [Candidatus Uhrbacteria bacterium RIFCSPLOWO2_02_FULL_46_25]